MYCTVLGLDEADNGDRNTGSSGGGTKTNEKSQKTVREVTDGG